MVTLIVAYGEELGLASCQSKNHLWLGMFPKLASCSLELRAKHIF